VNLKATLGVGMDPWFVFEGALDLRGVDLEEEGATREKAAL